MEAKAILLQTSSGQDPAPDLDQDHQVIEQHEKERADQDEGEADEPVVRLRLLRLGDDERGDGGER